MLSIILFVILLCLSGVTLLSVVGRGSLSRVELVGLSFPVGMLLAVGLMMLQDLLRLRLSLVCRRGSAPLAGGGPTAPI